MENFICDVLYYNIHVIAANVLISAMFYNMLNKTIRNTVSKYSLLLLAAKKCPATMQTTATYSETVIKGSGGFPPQDV